MCDPMKISNLTDFTLNLLTSSSSSMSCQCCGTLGTQQLSLQNMLEHSRVLNQQTN